jgi:hypothetical protein
MYSFKIPEINDSIRKTRKAIISLGCSFVQGHGAIDQKIYDRYKWNHDISISPYTTWDLTKSEKKEISNEYANISLYENLDGIIDINFSAHELENSFVEVLAKKYFNGEYTPINLGRSGCGNRAAIKELYFYPGILWNDLDQIIVIYCPSGSERFDFMQDEFHTLNDHERWIAMWPNSDDTSTPRNTLWKGYKDSIYSQKFEILEQIAHIQELILWCKHMKAKLIIVPSFQRIYTRDHFTRGLSVNITRDGDRNLTGSRKIFKIIPKEILKMVDMWPWENMFYPEGLPTWMDFIMKQEHVTDYDEFYFWNYVGKGSPNKWVTPCAHPSANAHDLFAKLLHRYIETSIL